MFSNALASRITRKSCVVALSGGLFFESCYFDAVCVRYLQKKKKRNPFKDFFLSCPSDSVMASRVCHKVAMRWL